MENKYCGYSLNNKVMQLVSLDYRSKEARRPTQSAAEFIEVCQLIRKIWHYQWIFDFQSYI